MPEVNLVLTNEEVDRIAEAVAAKLKASTPDKPKPAAKDESKPAAKAKAKEEAKPVESTDSADAVPSPNDLIEALKRRAARTSKEDATKILKKYADTPSAVPADKRGELIAELDAEEQAQAATNSDDDWLS